MNRQPQATTPLAALPPDERTRALERYRMLQPCVEHDVPLTHVARPHDMPLRTLVRWHARYRRYGLAGLSRRGGRYRGHARRLRPELKAVIEGLALRTPPPTVAFVHTPLILRQALWRKPVPQWHICGIPEILYRPRQ